MSGRVKQRSAANNTLDSATVSVNERILRECHSVYVDPDNGLIQIASNLGLVLLPPRKKVTILLIGNHSAGKSSFINWYIEEHVQKTGVAIETQGFTFVTSGKKRESLTGNATLHLYPHFKPLQQKSGVVDYLTTEISTSKQKKFSLVTFIDTPGLVDGDMKYPFDVNDAITWLGGVSDLIFVFFDPIGQALCKRTLNLVEKLNDKHSEKIRMFLSKADEAGHESDRQKVLMQIVQELCKRPGLNKCAFDMPTIYIPNPNKPVRCVNQIEEVCKEIEKTIQQTVQTTINTLEKDCERIAALVDKRIQDDNFARSYNFQASGRGICFGALGILLPFVLLINFLASNTSRAMMNNLLGPSGIETLNFYLSPVRGFWTLVPGEYHIYALLSMLFISLIFWFLGRWLSKWKPTLSRKQKKALLENREFVLNFVKFKKQKLYEEYLKQSIADQDLL